MTPKPKWIASDPKDEADAKWDETVRHYIISVHFNSSGTAEANNATGSNNLKNVQIPMHATRYFDETKCGCYGHVDAIKQIDRLIGLDREKQELVVGDYVFIK